MKGQGTTTTIRRQDAIDLAAPASEGAVREVIPLLRMLTEGELHSVRVALLSHAVSRLARRARGR